MARWFSSGLIFAWVAVGCLGVAAWQFYRHNAPEPVAAQVMDSTLSFRVVTLPDGGRQLGSEVTVEMKPADEVGPHLRWTIDTASFGFAEPAVDVLEQFVPGTQQSIPTHLAESRRLRPVDLLAEPLLESAIRWLVHGLVAGALAVTLWMRRARKPGMALLFLVLGWPLLLYPLAEAVNWAWDVSGQTPIEAQRVQPEHHFQPTADHARIRFGPGARELLQGRNYQLYAYQVQGRTYHYATIGLDGADTGLFFTNPGNPWELLRKRTSWLDWALDSMAETSAGLFLLFVGHFLRKVN